MQAGFSYFFSLSLSFQSKRGQEIFQAAPLGHWAVVPHQNLAQATHNPIFRLGRLGGRGAGARSGGGGGAPAGTQRKREGEGERVVSYCCFEGKGRKSVCAGGAELGDLGVCEGVLFFPGVFGVDVLDLLADWGFLMCLPALPGVLLWVLASEAIKSLFTPLCLDVVLQAWQVAIWI